MRSPQCVTSATNAMDECASGRPVVLFNDADPDDGGALAFAACQATTALVAFTVRHTSGYVCVPMTGSDCDRLDLPPIPVTGQSGRTSAYTVTVDAKAGITTGISAVDRAHTIRRLADPRSAAGDFTRPGHIVPVRVADRGVLDHAGLAEAAVDLARLAGLASVGVFGQIVSVNDPGALAGREELQMFADANGLAYLTVSDLVAHRRTTERRVRRIDEGRVSTSHGNFRAVHFLDELSGGQHLALVRGEPEDGEDVPILLHQECLLGDVFSSLRCDCAAQLDIALASIAATGQGAVVYLRIPGAHRTEPHRHDERVEVGSLILADLRIRSARVLPASVVTAEALRARGVRACDGSATGRRGRRRAREVVAVDGSVA